MKGKRKGKIVILHLAVRYPFAGVVWQLLHHLVGFARLGLDVYYIEDHRAYVYDPAKGTAGPDPTANLRLIGGVLERYGFGDRFSFLDSAREEYIGMSRARCHELLAEADAVINLCGATELREEHLRSPCTVYLETDPGMFEVELARGIQTAREIAAAHRLFFTYGANIGASDCALPDGGICWHFTRPPVLLDEWPALEDAVAPPRAFTTIGTWRNKSNDLEIGGQTYYWSKHVNFRPLLEVAARANQPIELATDLQSGADYERALRGGFTFRSALGVSLDPDQYRRYISASRGEFTVAKDLYVRTRSGWFSDRTACYLAAGRPVATQRTGFEKFVPEGLGLLGFDDAEQAVQAINAINSDYPRHRRAAREIAAQYFDAERLLDAMAEVLGL